MTHLLSMTEFWMMQSFPILQFPRMTELLILVLSPICTLLPITDLVITAVLSIMALSADSLTIAMWLSLTWGPCWA